MTDEIIVKSEDNGVKPKNFLKRNLDIPFYLVVKFIKEKRITLNGKKIKKESVLKTGDKLKIWHKDYVFIKPKINQKEKKDLKIPIIFENEDFIVFNKLPQIIVQGAQENSTSLSLHLAYYKDKIKDDSSFEYFHAHRLDKETSGALVVAKNKIALRELNKIFRQKNITKKYTCLCNGEFKEKKGKVEVFMTRNAQGVKEKMKISKIKNQESKKSLSYYNVISEFEYDDETLSLVEVEIKTGITHQIRVHMKSLGHPIIGDRMYGNSAINRKFEHLIDRQFLHASTLNFEYENEKYEFKAPLTSDLDKFLNILRK